MSKLPTAMLHIAIWAPTAVAAPPGWVNDGSILACEHPTNNTSSDQVMVSYLFPQAFVAAPVMVTFPSSLSFGSRVIGTGPSPIQTFTVQNTGDQPLNGPCPSAGRRTQLYSRERSGPCTRPRCKHDDRRSTCSADSW
jgi:hypothetical protein